MRRDVARESTRAKDVVALTQAHNCDATESDKQRKPSAPSHSRIWHRVYVQVPYPQRTNATLLELAYERSDKQDILDLAQTLSMQTLTPQIAKYAYSKSSGRLIGLPFFAASLPAALTGMLRLVLIIPAVLLTDRP